MPQINTMLEWVTTNLKKYGVIVLILIATYYTIKKSWFWLVLPSLGFIALHQIFLVTNSGWIGKLNPIFFIAGWIFLFSFLKKIFGGLFEKT